MTDDSRPSSLAEGLARVGLRPRSQQPGTYTLDCPRCSRTRKGKKTGSLHLKIDQDGMGAVWSCFNAGRVECEWNAPQGFRVAGASARTGRAAPRVYRRPPVHERTPDAAVIEWFRGRGISARTVAECGVRAARVWMPQTEREEDVIAFPYKRDGEILNWKYRGRNKIFRQEKDAEKIPFGHDDCVGKRSFVVVEGEIDKMALWEAGVTAAISVPDGAPSRLKDEVDPHDPKFLWIANASDLFRPPEEGGPEEIIIAVDGDEPGQILEAEVGRRAGLDRCKRVRWPEGCKDANDVLMRHGPEALVACLANAQPFPLDGVMRVEDVSADVFRLYDDGMPPGIPLGFDCIDFPDGAADEPMASLQPGQLVILTGSPGSGKSEWWDQVMLNTARCTNWSARQRERFPGGFRWAVLSMETGIARHIAGLAMKLTRKPFRTGPTERMSRDELANAMEWLNERFLFLHPRDGAPTLPWIEDTVKAAVRRFGINGYLVDPYTEVGKDRSNGERDTDIAEAFLTRLRRLGRVHELVGAIIAHPAKPARDAPRLPGLYDISGSAHFANKADLGISLFRDRDNPSAPVEVHIKKVRFSENGRLGHVELEYVKLWNGYRDLGPRRLDEA